MGYSLGKNAITRKSKNKLKMVHNGLSLPSAASPLLTDNLTQQNVFNLIKRRNKKRVYRVGGVPPHFSCPLSSMSSFSSYELSVLSLLYGISVLSFPPYSTPPGQPPCPVFVSKYFHYFTWY